MWFVLLIVDFKFLIHSLDSIVDKVPWSLIKILRHLNLMITFSNKKFVAFLALQSLAGVNSSHLVRYYVTTMMQLSLDHFVGGLIGPTKCMAHLSNTFKVTCGLRGISSLLLGLPTL
jgi:hypothetical protein